MDGSGPHPREALPGVLVGELDPVEAAGVAAHLQRRDGCRRDLASIAFAAAALRSLARASLVEPARPPALPDPPVEEKRVRAGGPVPRRGQRRWAVIGAVAGLALLTGGVGAAIGAVLATSTRPGAPPAAGPAVVLQPVAATTVSGSARMSGAGDGQVMTIEVRGLPAPATDGFHEVWLLGDRPGSLLAVGLLPPQGRASYALPASLARHFSTIDVSIEPNDGDPTHSARSLLRGRY